MNQPTSDPWNDILPHLEIEHFWWDEKEVKLRIGGRDGTNILFALLEPYNKAGDIITVDPHGQPPRTVTRPPLFITRELTPLERLGPADAPYSIDQYRLLE